MRAILDSVMGLVNIRPDYLEADVVRRIVEPDRVIGFRVVWADDGNRLRVNRVWRVQLSNAIGPYKGGLRFHPEVNLDLF